MRFSIRIDPWWWPLLAVSGVFPASPHYVSLDEEEVLVRLGWLRTRFLRSQIVAARRVRGDWRWSIGWHLILVGTKALIVNGSWADMVELQLDPPLVSGSLIIPIRCTCVRFSLEQPEAFLAALGSSLGKR